MSVQPEFIAPPAPADPAATTAPPAAAGESDENLTPEEAVAEINRLRESEAKWTALSRKHERENKALKAKGATPPAAPAAAAPAAAADAGPSDAELRALRFEVAIDKGLPKSLAIRLQGTTREEMESDAEDLAKLVTPKPVLPAGSADGGVGGAGKPVGRPFDEMVRQAAGIKVATNY